MFLLTSWPFGLLSFLLSLPFCDTITDLPGVFHHRVLHSDSVNQGLFRHPVTLAHPHALNGVRYSHSPAKSDFSQRCAREFLSELAHACDTTPNQFSLCSLRNQLWTAHSALSTAKWQTFKSLLNLTRSLLKRLCHRYNQKRKYQIQRQYFFPNEAALARTQKYCLFWAVFIHGLLAASTLVVLPDYTPDERESARYAHCYVSKCEPKTWVRVGVRGFPQSPK